MNNEVDFSQMINTAKAYMSHTAKNFGSKTQNYQDLVSKKSHQLSSTQAISQNQFSPSEIYQQLACSTDKEGLGLFKSERHSKNSDVYDQL